MYSALCMDTVYDSGIYTFRLCKLFKYTISSMLNITGFLRFLWFPPIETRDGSFWICLYIYYKQRSKQFKINEAICMRTNEINL